MLPSPFDYEQLHAKFPELPITSLIVCAFEHARNAMPDYMFNHFT
jgi:hypothetical protein